MTATYVACLTPPGAGAIATLALRGPDTWTLARALFQPPLPVEPECGRFWLGRMGDPADDVVLAVRSVASEVWLEVHCHGGRQVVAMLEQWFAAQGVAIVPWTELERLSAGDDLRAAALETLANALTPRTAAIALDQVHGALARAVADIRAALERDGRAAAESLLVELEGFADIGRHLAQPWKVVLAGAPNVGKSSLGNALAGYQRSVVHATPGTTRDVVTTLLAIDGWPLELADTAGWRHAAGLEGEGIARAGTAAQDADLCLWILDPSAAPTWPPPNLPRVCLVLNKIDLLPAWNVAEAAGALRVSAATGAGLAELCSAVSARLVPKPPPGGAPVPFTPVLADAVSEVRRALTCGADADVLGGLAKLRGECR